MEHRQPLKERVRTLLLSENPFRQQTAQTVQRRELQPRQLAQRHSALQQFQSRESFQKTPLQLVPQLVHLSWQPREWQLQLLLVLQQQPFSALPLQLSPVQLSPLVSTYFSKLKKEV